MMQIPDGYNLKDWAKYYASVGFKVFPLHEKGKNPATEHGFYDASSDLAQIEKWWNNNPYANIGIRTGRESGGLLVIDIDNDPDTGKDGPASIKEFEKSNGCLPKTNMVITGRLGSHYYYKNSGEMQCRTGVLDGVDIRCDGGYVVAPPSIHPNGRRYEWDIESIDCDIPFANEVVLKLCTFQQPANNQQVKIPENILPGKRNDTLYRLACSLQSKGLSDVAIHSAIKAENEQKCNPPIDDIELERIVNSALTKQKGKIASSGCSYKPNDYSEAGDSLLFAEIHAAEMRWTNSLGWMVWDGLQWLQDENAAKARVIAFTSEQLKDAHNYLTNSIHESATGEPSLDAKQYYKFAQKMRNNSSINAILSLSTSKLASQASIFDSDPFLLNTPSGIVNLKNGEVHKNEPSKFCSKITACTPGIKGMSMWKEFLRDITGDDEDLINYLQLSAGSCAIGKVFHEGIQIAEGGGRNGKSTYYNALSLVLGEYSGNIDVNVLTTDRQNKGAAKATLRGKRLVSCGELEDGQRLSTQTLKQLASTDLLTIEEKYKAPETIKPSHHIVMFSNHLPRVGSTDDGTWRRITLIPFHTTIPKGNDKPNYAETLYEQAGEAILTWIIEGARLYCANGFKLKEPEVVIAATKKYRQQEDWLSNFLAEECITGSGCCIQVGVLYNRYRAYAENTGSYRRSMADFNRSLESAGFKKVKVHGNKTEWQGIGIVDSPVNGFHAISNRDWATINN